MSSMATKFAVVLSLCMSATSLHAAPPSAPKQPSKPSPFEQAVERVIEQEHALLKLMGYFQPIAETYLQNIKPMGKGFVPAGDDYFLGQLRLKDGHVEETSYLR